MSNPKVFMNLRNHTETGDIRNFTKPKYLITNNNIDQKGNKTVLSKFSGGWVTIDETKSLNRKNAPEVSRKPLTEEQKMKCKPNWMAQKML
jgi:hypothetical protein